MKLPKSFLVSQPLAFGKDDAAFTLLVRPVTGDDLAGMIDALCTNQFHRIARAAIAPVSGWAGVTDDDGVTAMPFEVVEPVIDLDTGEPLKGPDGKPITRKRNQLDRLFGAIGLEAYVQTVIGLLSYAGVPSALLSEIRKTIWQVAGISSETDPTQATGAGTPSTA